MEESGYAGFIMPIEVYFKNKVGARVAARRMHSSHKGQWDRQHRVTGWMSACVAETACWAPAGGASRASLPWWQGWGAGHVAAAGGGVPGHVAISHPESGRVPGSAATCWVGAGVYDLS